MSVSDVIIVGAGPTGLMAAALLRRCGCSVRLLDKSPTAAKESRAFGIQPRSMELFEKIGLAERLLALGLLATGAQIYVGGRRAAQLDFDEIGRTDTPYQFLLMVPQSEIEAVLVEEVARLGVEIERGVEVTTIETLPDRVRCEARTSQGAATIEGHYLIGADGAHSIVRKILQLEFRGDAYPQTFLLADCRVDWALDVDRFKLFVNKRAFGIFLPLKGRDLARVMAVDPHSPEATPNLESQGSSAVTLDEVTAAFRDAAGIDVKLSQAVWTSRYRVHHRAVSHYSVGRVFVAGDAAHIHSPAGGQGMNTGLQDAANLAWKLAHVLRGSSTPALLDTYHAERWPVGQKVLAATDKAFSFMTSQAGWAATARDLLLPVMTSAVSRSNAMRSKAFHFISQLGIRYHQGAYVQEAVSADAARPFRDGLRAGHRAPDATISRRCNLFDLIEGYEFDLLAISRTAMTETEIGGVHDELQRFGNSTLRPRVHLISHSLVGRDPRLIRAESGEIFSAYGIEGHTTQALYLLRPDGYIAWRADSFDFTACRRFIDAHFAVGR